MQPAISYGYIRRMFIFNMIVKNTKVVAVCLIPLLMLVVLIPTWISVQTAPEEEDLQEIGPVASIGVNNIKDDPSHTQIPSGLGEKDLVQWYATNTDVEKEITAREKQDVLSNALFPNGRIKADSIPVTGIGYDYIDNALEVRIEPTEFTDENIPQYIDKIREIVGDQIDITVAPEEYAKHTACDSRTETCIPLKGGP